MVTGDYVSMFSQLGNSVENVEKTSSPRYVKTHLPWDLLPLQWHEKKPKVFTVVIFSIYRVLNTTFSYIH